ncbi:MAG TPA: 2-oxo acid dehydrogenase subunit E2 [Dehalococcoidia bacterium]|nr:2-oxo acid dehydrogenase subunit E2 [Dehalococcoidia bacterium]
MAVAVIFPKLDEAMTSGKIVRWLKNEGEPVEKGEIILEIESEKTSFELEAETSGILSNITAQAGDEVPIGTTIAYILQPGEKAPEVETPIAHAAKEEKLKEEAKAEAPQSAGEPKDIKASPLARNIAIEHGVDLSLVTGTGPGGRITKDDVLKFAEAGKVVAASVAPEAPAGTEEETVPLSTMREVIARRMIESFQTPHFYLTMEVDAQELQRTRQLLLPVIEARTGIRLTLTDLIIKIAARALERNPDINCSYANGSLKRFKQIHIGLVTSVEGGLMVPVIRGASTKSLAEIAQARAELVQKARERTLSKEEMTSSTFTISNMGMYDIDQFSAIIQPPEAAILAVGRIAEKVVVRNGEMVIRPMMNLTLSIDHRILDGALGAQFLQTMKGYIEDPVNLVL